MAKRTKFQIHMKTALRFAKKVGVKDHKRAFKLATGTWTKATANRDGHPAANWKSTIQKAAKSGRGSASASKRGGSKRGSASASKRGSASASKRGGSKRGRRSARSGGGVGSRLDSVSSFLGHLGRRPQKKRGRGKPRKDSYASTKAKLTRIIKSTQKAQERLERLEERRRLTMKEKAEKKAAAAANKAAKAAHREVSAAQKEPVGSHWGGESPSGWGSAAHAAARHNDQEAGNRYDGDPDRRRKPKGKSKKRSSPKRSSSKSKARGGKRRVTQATRERMRRAARARWARGGKAKSKSAGSKRKSAGSKRKSGKSKKSSRDFSRFY